MAAYKPLTAVIETVQQNQAETNGEIMLLYHFHVVFIYNSAGGWYIPRCYSLLLLLLLPSLPVEPGKCVLIL